MKRLCSILLILAATSGIAFWVYSQATSPVIDVTVDVATTSQFRVTQDFIEQSSYDFKINYLENGEPKVLSGLTAHISAKSVEDVGVAGSPFIFEDTGTVYAAENYALFPVKPAYLTLDTNKTPNTRFEFKLMDGTIVDSRLQSDIWVQPSVEGGDEPGYVPPDPSTNYYTKAEIDAMLEWVAYRDSDAIWQSGFKIEVQNAWIPYIRDPQADADITSITLGDDMILDSDTGNIITRADAGSILLKATSGAITNDSPMSVFTGKAVVEDISFNDKVADPSTHAGYQQMYSKNGEPYWMQSDGTVLPFLVGGTGGVPTLDEVLIAGNDAGNQSITSLDDIELVSISKYLAGDPIAIQHDTQINGDLFLNNTNNSWKADGTINVKGTTYAAINLTKPTQDKIVYLNQDGVLTMVGADSDKLSIGYKAQATALFDRINFGEGIASQAAHTGTNMQYTFNMQDTSDSLVQFIIGDQLAQHDFVRLLATGAPLNFGATGPVGVGTNATPGDVIFTPDVYFEGDVYGLGAGAGTPNLTEVLTEGNDAGGLGMVNVANVTFEDNGVIRNSIETAGAIEIDPVDWTGRAYVDGPLNIRGDDNFFQINKRQSTEGLRIWHYNTGDKWNIDLIGSEGPGGTLELFETHGFDLIRWSQGTGAGQTGGPCYLWELYRPNGWGTSISFGRSDGKENWNRISSVDIPFYFGKRTASTIVGGPFKTWLYIDGAIDQGGVSVFGRRVEFQGDVEYLLYDSGGTMRTMRVELNESGTAGPDYFQTTSEMPMVHGNAIPGGVGGAPTPGSGDVIFTGDVHFEGNTYGGIAGGTPTLAEVLAVGDDGGGSNITNVATTTTQDLVIRDTGGPSLEMDFTSFRNLKLDYTSSRWNLDASNGHFRITNDETGYLDLRHIKLVESTGPTFEMDFTGWRNFKIRNLGGGASQWALDGTDADIRMLNDSTGFISLQVGGGVVLAPVVGQKIDVRDDLFDSTGDVVIDDNISITGTFGNSIDIFNDVDTTTTAPTTDQVLQWNGSNWIPGTVAGASTPTLSQVLTEGNDATNQDITGVRTNTSKQVRIVDASDPTLVLDHTGNRTLTVADDSGNWKLTSSSGGVYIYNDVANSYLGLSTGGNVLLNTATNLTTQIGGGRVDIRPDVYNSTGRFTVDDDMEVSGPITTLGQVFFDLPLLVGVQGSDPTQAADGQLYAKGNPRLPYWIDNTGTVYDLTAGSTPDIETVLTQGSNANGQPISGLLSIGTTGDITSSDTAFILNASAGDMTLQAFDEMILIPGSGDVDVQGDLFDSTGDFVINDNLSITGTFGNSIDILNDVDTTTTAPTTNQVLSWNGANWIPATAAGGATPDIEDVLTAGSNANGQPISGLLSIGTTGDITSTDATFILNASSGDMTLQTLDELILNPGSNDVDIQGDLFDSTGDLRIADNVEITDGTTILDIRPDSVDSTVWAIDGYTNAVQITTSNQNFFRALASGQMFIKATNGSTVRIYGGDIDVRNQLINNATGTIVMNDDVNVTQDLHVDGTIYGTVSSGAVAAAQMYGISPLEQAFSVMNPPPETGFHRVVGFEAYHNNIVRANSTFMADDYTTSDGGILPSVVGLATNMPIRVEFGNSTFDANGEAVLNFQYNRRANAIFVSGTYHSLQPVDFNLKPTIITLDPNYGSDTDEARLYGEPGADFVWHAYYQVPAATQLRGLDVPVFDSIPDNLVSYPDKGRIQELEERIERLEALLEQVGDPP